MFRTRILTVDADIEHNAKVLNFYKKNGFLINEELYNKNRKTVSMRKDIFNYNADGSKCYSNSEASCTTYGRLYNWNTAINVCPSGWHLPSDVEWGTFLMFIDSGCKIQGNCPMAGKLLKATSSWNSNGNGTDAYGFAALPSGKYTTEDGSIELGNEVTWWTSTESNGIQAVVRRIEYNKDGTSRISLLKKYFYSVRCLKD